MDKVLFVATVDSHILNFHIPYIKYFKEEGYEVHVASNGSKYIPYVDMKYNIPFKRSPYNVTNYTVYQQLKKVINENKYELIHCHTPMGSVLTRLAARNLRKLGTKVLYTAHGFHFYKGAPIINWLLYYPIERFLARYTDVLITINKEDYKRAQRFKAKRVEYVSGVGIDLDKFNTVKVDKDLKRNELGLPKNSFVLLSVGELNKNKNHEIVIKALAKLNNREIHYLICGQGPLESYLKDLAKQLGVEEQIHLLGFRKDIAEICRVSDVFIFPSFREGLPVAIMESMASGLPVVCSNIRGNTDLIEDGANGYLVNPYDIFGFTNAIEKLYKDDKLRNDFGVKSFQLVRRYSLENVMIEMEKVYFNRRHILQEYNKYGWGKL